jgi:hypothetical protein
MSPIRAAPASRSKLTIPSLDRENPFREMKFAADNLRKHHRNQCFRDAAGSTRLRSSRSRWGHAASSEMRSGAGFQTFDI